jgi:hypothetical protein
VTGTALMQTPEALAEGKSLHVLMDEAVRASGLALPDHPEDEQHDRAVGAAVILAKHGNPDEAARFYNEWASANGYPGTRIVSRAPLHFDLGIDIGGMVAELSADNITILSCGPWVRPGYVRLEPGFYTPMHLVGQIVPTKVAA